MEDLSCGSNGKLQSRSAHSVTYLWFANRSLFFIIWVLLGKSFLCVVVEGYLQLCRINIGCDGDSQVNRTVGHASPRNHAESTIALL
jgi:hypothetical protein